MATYCNNLVSVSIGKEVVRHFTYASGGYGNVYEYDRKAPVSTYTVSLTDVTWAEWQAWETLVKTQGGQINVIDLAGRSFSGTIISTSFTPTDGTDYGSATIQFEKVNV